MPFMFDPVDEENQRWHFVIKVIGVGRSGGNAVDRMIYSQMLPVDFIIANKNPQVILNSVSATNHSTSQPATLDLGSGAPLANGCQSAENNRESIKSALNGAHMVFVVCGMGGNTGSDASHMIAGIAKEVGALTVGVVTNPFAFEGLHRIRQAEKAIEDLQEIVDTLIVIPSENLFGIIERRTGVRDAFRMADDALLNAIQSITDVILYHGVISVDFADVCVIMADGGLTRMGVGTGRGEKRATVAANHAINSPLLEDINLDDATGLLVNCTGGSNFSLAEVKEAMDIIISACDEECNIIYNCICDTNPNDECRVTIIPTGFNLSKTMPDPVVRGCMPLDPELGKDVSITGNILFPGRPHYIGPTAGWFGLLYSARS